MSTRPGEELERNSKCQDCGNQAKKGCLYMRCRTCCKNKGFECQTHVKSTWVSVDRRRQREKQSSPSIYTQHLQGDFTKRHKQNPYADLEEMKFPACMSSMAIFRCVGVRSMDGSVNEYAYHTSVNIGGHVFSGLLYDQGPDRSVHASSGGDSFTVPLQHHNLINAATQTHDGATVAPLSATSADQSVFPLTAFIPGMPYFSR